MTMHPGGGAAVAADVAICAALYAVVKGLTAPIPTPWQVGQFLPGVVVPALFSITRGGWVGGAGAALGTFVGDTLFLTPLHLTNPFLSLVAGVPSNFVGFLLFGRLLGGRGSWSRFTVASALSLCVGNLVAAVGVVAVLFSYLPPNAQLVTVIGLTFFWFATMVPFMFTLLPLMMRAVASSPTAKRWAGPSWGGESRTRVFAAGAISSVPLFGLFALSLGPWFASLLGPLNPVSATVSYLVLASAITMLCAPVAPYLAGPKRG